jgi:hypothetical protein
MAKAQHTTVASYLAALPDDRREALEAVRATINANLPRGYREGMQYGMPSWFVPHELYPKGYHCDAKQPLPFVHIALQKNHMALYLFCVYTDPAAKEWFVDSWKASGCRLDMGASCVRFKKLEQVPLDVVGEAIRRMPVEKFIAEYEKQFVTDDTRRRNKPASKKPASKKTGQNAAAKKKTTAKKAASKKKSAGTKVAKKTAKKNVAKKRG